METRIVRIKVTIDPSNPDFQGSVNDFIEAEMGWAFQSFEEAEILEIKEESETNDKTN